MRIARLPPLIVLLVVGCDTSSGAKVAASVGVDCTVGSVTVSPASASMLVGDSAQLTAKTPPPPCGTGGGFFWRSSNSAVATVDSTGGKVRAVAVGQATIIALLVSDTAVKGAGAITVNSR